MKARDALAFGWGWFSAVSGVALFYHSFGWALGFVTISIGCSLTWKSVSNTH